LKQYFEQKNQNTAIINYKIVNSVIVTPTTYIDIACRGKCEGNVVSVNVINVFKGPGVRAPFNRHTNFTWNLLLSLVIIIIIIYLSANGLIGCCSVAVVTMHVRKYEVRI